MEIKPKQPTVKGPADWFTGDVWIDGLVQPDDQSTLNVSAVHFHPGARTAWHTHDGGQILYVTAGEGQVPSRAEPIVTIRAGDVVRTPSGECHWPGSAPERIMTHLSFTQGLATRADPVTDDE